MPSKILNKLYHYTAPNGLCAWLVLIQAYIYSNELDSTIIQLGEDDLQERETRLVIKRILKEMMPVLLEMEGDKCIAQNNKFYRSLLENHLSIWYTVCNGGDF